MAVLAQALATPPGQAKGLRELIFDTTRFIDAAVSECLATGLASNTTLKSLHFWFRRPERRLRLNGASLAGILNGLASHPSLEELGLHRCDFERQTMESIHGLLGSDGCHLRDLVLCCWNIPYGLNIVQLFVQDLPRNTSLEHLTFSEHPLGHSVDENDIIPLLGSLWKLPNLRSLSVEGNKIRDFVTIAANLAGTAMPAHRLRSLNIDGETPKLPMVNAHLLVQHLQRLKFFKAKFAMQPNHERSILRLLEDVFPELCYLGEEFAHAVRSGIVPSSVGLQLDRNRYQGRLLRGGAATLPLSVWPLVMANANENATMLYEMLHGPAFRGRGSL